MSSLLEPTPGLFFASFLYRNDLESRDDLLKWWEDKQGKSLLYHHSYFPMAGYYSKEMGGIEKLSRFFAMGLMPSDRKEFVDLKHWATDYENALSENGKRRVNIDIGLLTLENVTLATGKNYVHRTFIGRGVFSDLTLTYESGTFKKLPWSYPDYSHPQVIDFFNWSRSFLHGQINLKNSPISLASNSAQR